MSTDGVSDRLDEGTRAYQLVLAAAKALPPGQTATARELAGRAGVRLAQAVGAILRLWQAGQLVRVVAGPTLWTYRAAGEGDPKPLPAVGGSPLYEPRARTVAPSTGKGWRGAPPPRDFGS